MQVLLKKEWQLPESAAQECCDHFLRQFRNCPDHTDFDLDDWRSFLWASALDLDYQHLAGISTNFFPNLIYLIFFLCFISFQKVFSRFGRNCDTLT